MNFQDLFARYREMGAMAPQHTLDEQLLMLSGDPVSMDLLEPENNSEEIKKEPPMFKLLSPNNFRPFLMSMEEEHKQGLSRDEEVEDLLQPSPPQLQQGWNLGLLKTNSLCKDYYKLTSNMLQTLVMGIKEFTNGEISPAWQVAQNRGHQKQSNFSNKVLQDVANKPMTPIDSNSTAPIFHGFVEPELDAQSSIDLENKCGPPLKLSLNKSGGQPPTPKAIVERSRDIDGILELRTLLWRQIVPYTCLGANLDPKLDMEKKIRLLQESRMKVVNIVGFGVHSKNNCTFHETSQVSLMMAQKQVASKESDLGVQLSLGTPSMDNEQNRITSSNSSRIGDSMEPESIDGDGVEEEVHSRSTSHKQGGDYGSTKAQYSVSFPEEDVDMQLEEEYGDSREVIDMQPSKRSKFSIKQDTRPEQPKSSRSKFHARETRFFVDGQILPIYDHEFEIVGEDKENPSRYPDGNLLGHVEGEDGSNQHFLINRNEKHFRQPGMTQYKEEVVQAKPTTRSWCIVGSFNTRSQTTSRSNHSHPQKSTKQSKSKCKQI